MAYSIFLGWLGWYYVPRFVTQQALHIVHHGLATVFHVTPPRQGTPLYQTHYRIAYSVVVLGYLVYNLISSALSVEPNFYQHLGVSPDVDLDGLKTAFKQSAKRNHPDRPGISSEDSFMAIRGMYEVLKNPVLRFAYDRFGKDVVGWKNMSTERDYLINGIMQSSGYHAVTGLFLLIYSSIGRPSPVKYWRYVLYLSLLALELAYLLYVSPTTSSQRTLLHILFPQRVAYQHILFLHQLFLFLSTALSNVAPQLFPNNALNEMDGILERFIALSSIADREASVLLQTELHAIHPSTPESRISLARMRPVENPSADVMETLSDEIEKMIIEKNLMQDTGPLRSVWEHAIEHGRSLFTAAHPPRSNGKVSYLNGSLPSPVSPTGSVTKLPSPRPSPPPGLVRRGTSYVRARSVSY